MATDQFTKLCVIALLCFLLVTVSLQDDQSLLSCDTNSPDAFGYRCNETKPQDQCETFAVFRTNSYYSSLFNLSYYLGLNQTAVAEASGFSSDTEFLPQDQPLQIPVVCVCNGGFFQAGVTKTTVKGESFYGISESLEGLTTCKAIRDENPSISPWNLDDKLQLMVPLRCACPSDFQLSQGTKLLLSYPISEGDTVSDLSSKFNATLEAIISANNRSEDFNSENLVPISTLLIPLSNSPTLGLLLGNPDTNIPVVDPPHSGSGRSTLLKIGVYIVVSGIAIGVSVAIAAAIVVIQRRRKKPKFCKTSDVELQQLSIRTPSYKESFEDRRDHFDNQSNDTTHHKLLETYTTQELRKATEDFNSNNLIEGSVFHGRLNGKNLAIKQTLPKTISKIDFSLFHGVDHRHPHILRLLGTCLNDDTQSFLVFEYAKNGSLKDWLHAGLAMKSQFIASYYCFLTWNQRLRICLDVAIALQYMHHIMHPSYVHRNIKSRNIFLDEEFHAKVGNFGMSRCVNDDSEEPQSPSAHSTSWSKGYLAPEFVQHGIISSSTDIFAYGVVLLEVLSGQTPITRDKEKGGNNFLLSEKIKSILNSGDADELGDWIDPALGNNYSFDAAVSLANLARACVEEDPSARPTAGDIVYKLQKLAEEFADSEEITSCGCSSKSQTKEVVSINPEIPN
ncbi:PREDICTED: protein LYK2-like [Nelumbo nucifera]|uniref:Protein LYK2-like n=2 Tax=Nelumbo nucifera TaxID=4432 RepID=A0A822YQA9_NELNU|nr:PREDICTED: protein LYK2-like [Nelumbo nucifera]DAD34283.1 TPA_asm: hypothetical protein HUJ06_004923 [Nelumbo nucifera]